MKNHFISIVQVFLILCIIGLFVLGGCINSKDQEDTNQIKTITKTSEAKEIVDEVPIENTYERLYYSPLTNEVYGATGFSSSSSAYNLHYKNYILYYSEEEGFYYYNASDFKTHLRAQDFENLKK